jgi:hypothetical protein
VVFFDVAIRKNNWKFGLMLRDITTILTWNIGEANIRKLPIPFPENQELPESTEITAPKHN